ncbi:MAG TPA: phosphoenolpyruvate--protein phosphotransferase [Gaiellaceae bacterium]|jgi:multiphosphoryl transfer protein|nr:phosphoenolpyruvate--protein phosphotransferase [Gaiellaceae bacterium]
MVGLVIVSHSAMLAEGVAELARGMGADVPIELAGGIDAPEPALGTDATRVLEAIERADQGDGVVVLMDLGSAVLSAEMALDLLPPERRERVVLCEAPLVEGAVAAAVTAKLDASLEEVAAEARGSLAAKVTHLAADEPVASAEAAAGDGEKLTVEVQNPLGLHARPAARLVQTVGGFDAEVTVTNVTTARGPASGRSLNALATLGVSQGHEILVTARGPEAGEAVAAIAALAERDFDDAPAAAPPPPAARPPAAPAGALAGLAAAPGTALGAARHFRLTAPEIPTEPASDPQAEWEALERAIERVRAEIQSTRESVAARAGEYSAAIFDAHLLFLDDDALLEPARRAIFEQGQNAAQAWQTAAETVAAQYRRLDDEYLRARAEDLTGVARQVVGELLGETATAAVVEPGIVVAPDLTPADTAALDRELVRGIATAFGGPTSHSAILARSLGIPAAVGIGERILDVPEGTPLVLDGDAGAVFVDPTEELVRDYEQRNAQRQAAARLALASAHQPARTLDGRRIEVVANVGSPADVDAAVANGAEGVGLLRTEFLFLERDSLPSENEQYAAYEDIARRLDGRPLILRTLDVGADKPLPYLPRRPEANPFLGIRGIRLGLAQPELLETQLRAALRVAVSRPLSVMFPMVATLAEYRAATAVLARAREDLEADMDVGVMIEVPAAALAAEAFADEVDFFSIGTNDLVQYTMAAERGNDAVAGLADPLHPAVLRLIRFVTEAAEAHGKWVGVCGELAADRLAVPILVGLGVSELSVNPPAIPATKEAVRQLDAGAAADLAGEALRLVSAEDVRALVSAEITRTQVGS